MKVTPDRAPRGTAAARRTPRLVPGGPLAAAGDGAGVHRLGRRGRSQAAQAPGRAADPRRAGPPGGLDAPAPEGQAAARRPA